MTFRTWVASGLAATLGFAATTALAQEAPGSTNPKQDEEGQDPEQEVAAPKPKLHELMFGGAYFKGDPVLNQYANPFRGFGLMRLRLLFPLTEDRVYSRLTVGGMPGQDNREQAIIQFNEGRSMVSVDRHDFQNYVYDWRPRDESLDKATTITLDQKIAPGIGGFLSYRSGTRDIEYAAPVAPDQSHSQTVAIGVGGNVLGGSANLSASERRLSYRNGLQPNSLQRHFAASYSRYINDAVSLIGSASVARVEQVGVPSSNVSSLALGGNWDLSQETMLQFQFSDQDLDINSIENAYVRRRTFSSVRLLHNVSDWAFQLGYKHQETERVRADQTFVDVPRTDTLDFRVSGKFGATRMTIRGNTQQLSSGPVMQYLEDESEDPETVPQLFWDNKAMLQARFEGTGDKVIGYGVYTYRHRRNQGRDVSVDWHNVALGASYMYNYELSGYAEVSVDQFSASGGAETGQTLDFYFPKATNFAFGLDWAKDANTSASANLNYFESGDVRGTQLTFSLKHVFPSEDQLEIILAPWSRDDRQLDLTGFSSTFFSARYTVRF